MNELKKQVKESFRMEMMGTGLYRALSRHYRHNPHVSQRLMDFSEQEAMHGRLFQQYYRKTFGKTLRGEKTWLLTGRFVALIMRPMSLESKLKKIGTIENKAVQRIEDALSTGEDNGYIKIIKRILPDEKAHASLYGELYTG